MSDAGDDTHAGATTGPPAPGPATPPGGADAPDNSTEAPIESDDTKQPETQHDAGVAAADATLQARRATEVAVVCQGLEGLLFLDPASAEEVEAFFESEGNAPGVYPPTRGFGKPQW